MHFTPHHVKVTAKDIRALARDGSIPAESYEKVKPYFEKAERYFPKFYTLASFKGPTLASQTYSAVLRPWLKSKASAAQPTPPLPETCAHPVFARVLQRAEAQMQLRPPAAVFIRDLEVPAKIRRVTVKERTNGESRSANGWGPLQIGKRERLGVAQALCLEVSVATYPDVNLNILSLGSVALRSGNDPIFDSESRLMVSPMTHGIDSMIHAAITALIVPKSLMEVRAAIKHAFSTAWFASLRRGEGEIFFREEYRSNAAIFLISAISFRKHLFVANVGRNQAFLWRNGSLRPLSVVHDMTDPVEARRVSRNVDWSRNEAISLANGEVSRSLSKYGGGKQARPQVSCLPLSEVTGGHLVIVSPGVIESIGHFIFRRLFEGFHEKEIVGTILECARLCGLNDDICVVVVPLIYAETGV